ncbi:hypothetical protein GCM10018790_70630 [Kitasatospora xanthocidica]|uniref:DUF397 domain-containing protein n=1 Tax=Kitasatospora xanthocidica TaxID=83382 RepID=UPI001672A0CA|nr:DUF397 domain-containing protein [Kitasatospora xanthocidica]GHF82776.1 hypothetical protein GCM10018790_70630 [Kitasatospora xanthocidica]
MADRVDLASAAWFRSSYSNNGGDCIEVTADFPGLAPVRDSKDPQGPALLFPSAAWESFVAAVRGGEFGDI